MIFIFTISIQYLHARTFSDPGVKLEGVTINSTTNINTQNVVKDPNASFSIKIQAVKGGSIKANLSKAKAGEAINLTLKNNGKNKFKTGSLTINNGAVAVKGENNQYSFIMPSGDVLVKAEFEGPPKTKKYPKGKITGSPHNWYAVGVGDWVYFTNANDNSKLYKMMNDGTKKTKLCDDKAYNINIANEYIYYTNGHEGNIFRIKTDGSDRTQLNKEDSSTVKVADGWIYYQHPWGYNRDMKKMKLDGSDVRTVTSDGYCGIYRIIDGWIYYFSGYFSKVKTDGSGKQVALRINYSDINIEEEWIYFTNRDRNKNICRIDLNGSNFSEINNEESSSINVYNGWIYYCNKDDGDKLYKIKTDGTQKSKLSDDKIGGINIVADWIYYGSQNKLYRVMLDGSNRQLI